MKVTPVSLSLDFLSSLLLHAEVLASDHISFAKNSEFRLCLLRTPSLPSSLFARPRGQLTFPFLPRQPRRVISKGSGINPQNHGSGFSLILNFHNCLEKVNCHSHHHSI